MFKQLSEPLETISVTLNGHKINAAKGMTVAALALSQNLPYTRTTPVSGARRAPFCMMGVCYDCLMMIDGIPNQRACATLLSEGMRIETQQANGPDWGER